MSGGKGGSTTSSVTIPEYIEAAAQRNLNKAERISQIGYTPYYGPDVAAFTPMQQAAFQGTAQTAGAFGLPGGSVSQQDIMGGMPAPTTYAGGVQGYSAAPIYEESLQALGERRPGQKAYIDSFFIDPYTGAAPGDFSPIDYTTYGTAADQAEANRQNALNIAAIQRTPSSTMTQEEMMRLGNIIAPGSGYNPMTDTLTPEQIAYVNDPANVAARVAQEDLAMSITGDANSNIIDAGKGLFNIEPSFDSPSSAGSYGGSLVTGGLSGDLTPIPGIAGNIADNIISDIAPGYAIEQQGKDFAESGGSTYDPNMSIVSPISGKTTTGGYDFDPTAFSADYGAVEIPVGVSPATPIPVADTSSGNSDQAAALAAIPTAPSFAIGGSLAAETDAIASDLSDDEFWEMAENDATVGAVLNMPTTPAPAIEDLRVPGTSTLSVNTSDTPAVGAVSDDGNWQAVVNPGTNAITRQWVGDSSSSNDSGGSDSGSDSGGGGTTVLCTAYASMGYLPADIWSLDTRYGIKRFRQDPVMVSGYRLWAAPIARFIKTDTFAAKVTRAILWPVVRAWAEEMAHTMKPQKYSGNKFGKLIMAMGEPFSYAVGATFLKRNAQKEL